MQFTITMQNGEKYVNVLPKIKSAKMADAELKLRRGGKYEFESKLSQAVYETLKLVTPRDMLFQSCIVCEHFQENEVCKMFNVRPPARIIVFGCSKYKESDKLDDDIPF